MGLKTNKVFSPFMNADATDTDQDLDPGNDPDSVGSSEQIPERALKAVGANPGAKHEGSVKTLIEDQKDMEIASVALNPEQVGSCWIFFVTQLLVPPLGVNSSTKSSFQ